MSELPRGTVTFLFTDIEGSTKLLQELGDGYVHALAQHRVVLREIFARHHGVEVDRQGDAFFVAFTTATEALAAATEGQAALHAGPVRVRMGLHTGEPFVTEEGYVGIDVHRAARIAAAGHGGQILISQSTRDLTGAESLRDLGKHRLKDLAAPEQVYQLGKREFPPLNSLNQTNLPIQQTDLVGRENELSELLELIRSVPLVTLTGPGGSGKTRLALHAAAESANEFGDGVWFVSLAAVSDVVLLEPTIAQSLGAGEDLGGFLRGKNLLLLLDNLEQLLPEAAPVVARLDIKVLATSRERLNIAGEQEYPVPNLVLESAVALFTQRARQLDREFEPDEHVVEIARRLDGLPLALELAAARVKVLSTEQIEERLASSLTLLKGGALDAPERQRTLRATIEWSYELLREDERRLFVSLAVFVGAFELDAAEEVCGAEIDLLQSLVDKNLLRHTADGRFFLLETILEFALEVFRKSSEVSEIRDRHSLHFSERAAALEQQRSGPHAAKVIAWFRTASANIRAALQWLYEGGDNESALRLATAAAPFWAIGSDRREGLERLEEAIRRAPDAAPTACAAALFWAADMAERGGEFERAAESLEQARDLYEFVGDRHGVCRCLSDLAWLALDEGRFDSAVEQAEEAHRIAIDLDDKGLIGRATRTLGNALINQGEREASISPLSDALAAYREVGDRAAVAATSISLAHAYSGTADASAVEELLAESEAISRELDLVPYTGSVYAVRAEIALERNDLGAAGEALLESIRIAMECESTALVAWALKYAAAVGARRGYPHSALRLLGAGESLAGRLGMRTTPAEQRVIDSTVACCERVLSSEAIRDELQRGRSTTLDDSVVEAQQVLAGSVASAPLFQPD